VTLAHLTQNRQVDETWGANVITERIAATR
jgi:hypothetical protein